MATMGSRIRSLRQKRKLTQAQLASRLGISQGSLSLIETGDTKDVAGQTLAALCRELLSTPEYIVAGSGDPSGVRAAMNEGELISLWRTLPPAGQQMLLDSAHAAVKAFSGHKTEHS